MKKIMFVLFALFLLALSSFALAEENDVDDVYDEDDTYENDVEDENEEYSEEETEEELELEEDEVVPSDTAKEVASFNSMTGAQVRMYQLVRSIDRNILSGREVMSRISSFEGYNEVEDTLNNLLDGLEDLKQEILDYEYSEDTNENVRAFVAFKQDSIALTNRFREAVRSFVSESNADRIRTQVREHVKMASKMREHADLLKEKVRTHNEQATRRAMERYGVLNETIINRIRNQEIEPEQIREQVLNQVRRMQNEREILNKMNEDAIKARVQARQEYEDNLARAREKQQNRLDERLQRANDTAQERISASNVRTR